MWLIYTTVCFLGKHTWEMTQSVLKCRTVNGSIPFPNFRKTKQLDIPLRRSVISLEVCFFLRFHFLLFCGYLILLSFFFQKEDPHQIVSLGKNWCVTSLSKGYTRCVELEIWFHGIRLGNASWTIINSDSSEHFTVQETHIINCIPTNFF